jgi:hypothetical protein
MGKGFTSRKVFLVSYARRHLGKVGHNFVEIILVDRL